jgi:hypothetical protein
MNYQLRMDELKATARELGVEPVGDRRKRETWELAIEAVGGYPILRAIKLAAENPPGVETEPVILSDRFVASYAPPQRQIHYQIEANGQLSLLDFQVESVVEEAPDPDDFEFLDAFHEAIALWDLQHPIDISLDSFTYWAPCPDEWYESAAVENSPGVDRVQALPESSDTLAASPGVEIQALALLKSSSTSDFFILVFGCDRPDEPPTAGLGARLPKPKPPSFSPSHPKLTPNAYQTHSCFVGGTVGHLGRSPPGGDVTI